MGARLMRFGRERLAKVAVCIAVIRSQNAFGFRTGRILLHAPVARKQNQNARKRNKSIDFETKRCGQHVPSTKSVINNCDLAISQSDSPTNSHLQPIFLFFRKKNQMI
jgi:hypothetical protein